jgi:hypothetical protein
MSTTDSISVHPVHVAQALVVDRNLADWKVLQKAFGKVFRVVWKPSDKELIKWAPKIKIPDEEEDEELDDEEQDEDEEELDEEDMEDELEETKDDLRKQTREEWKKFKARQ